MLDYTAVDFETANSYRGSPCSVGLVKVRNGQPVASVRWLTRPPAAAASFDAWNVAIHGITAEMVADAPSWPETLAAILEFIDGDVVVSHNAGFDIGVIRYACAADGIAWPALRFVCSLVLSRQLLALPSYRLPYVVDALGCTMGTHHDALDDAHAVVQVIAALAAKQRVLDLQDLARSAGACIGSMSAGLYSGSVITSGSNSRPVQADLNPDADPSGYLYGRVVVITGTLLSMTRQIAWDECAKVGAIAEQNTTKRTNVLVVADINPAVLRPGSSVTGKARRAFELQDKGQHIEVMTEVDFVRCLQGEPLQAAESLLSGQSGAPVEAQHSAHRRVPLDGRPTAKAPKAPRPLRRAPVPTDQRCSVEGCETTAAFRTRTKPTWCAEHIAQLQRSGGLRALEPFTRTDDWQLTECLACGVRAHYRFEYTLEKIDWNEPTCRACHWGAWASEVRTAQAGWADTEPISFDKARQIAEENGFEYLGPLTSPSLRDDPHHTQCRRCGKISAHRLGDISFGCTCSPRP